MATIMLARTVKETHNFMLWEKMNNGNNGLIYKTHSTLHMKMMAKPKRANENEKMEIVQNENAILII